MKILPLFFLGAISGLALAEPRITIHSSGSALVRETVPIELQPGLNQFSFSNATAQLEPDTIVLRDPAQKAEFRIVEQSYRNEPVSQALFLSLFEGKTLEFLRREPQKPDRLVTGKVVRSGLVPGGPSIEPLIEVDGKLQFSLPGDPLFPVQDSMLKPAIHWKLESRFSGTVDAELAYLTGGFSWEASYNVVEENGGDTVNLVACVTLKNQSGKTFENAKIKLLAGDIQRVKNPSTLDSQMGAVRVMAAPVAAMPSGAVEEAMDEFHFYTVSHPTTLRNQETKQVEFLRASGVKAERSYVLETEGFSFHTGTQQGKVKVFREIRNTEVNRLGVPLPKGKLRFYAQGSDRQLEFVGEGEVGHTPKDERVRVFTGYAFDLVGEHRVLHQTVDPANQVATQVVEIKVRNRKAEPVEIRVREHPRRGGTWRVLKETQPHKDVDADTFEFVVPLQPNEERVVTYTIQFAG